MTVILYSPEDVSFGGDPISAEDQTRIARALRGAVQRALENAATDSAARSQQDRRPGQDAGEAFDPARADRSHGTYRLPSYADEGELTGVKLLEMIPKAAPGYDVKDEQSPLEGGLIMSLPGLHFINIRSPRYATAGSLTEAYLLGLAVFGTTSFAILQGPLGSPKLRYWAVSTDPAVSNADIGRPVPDKAETGEELLPAELVGKAHFVASETLEVKVVGSDGGEYLVRGLITKDRGVHWKTTAMAAVWFAQAEAEEQKGVTAPPTVQFRRLVFADIDQLVTQIEGGDDTNLQRAAELLSRLDRVAFGLVDWQTKVIYLNVLLAAWTWQEQEVAVVQIFKSLRSDSEVDAVVAMLKQAGRYDQLFDDLDNELYDLLVTVGDNFPKDHGPLTLDGLIRLLQSMGLVPRTMKEALLGNVFEGPEGTSVPEAMLDEAYDAVMGFARFGADIGESIATIFTEPGKVIEGLQGLAQMLVKVELASLGYRPAVQEIANLLSGLGEKVLAGMRGADRLGCGEKVVRRIKWRLVWEIASLFVGLGEIKAVIQGAGIAEKLSGVLRFLAVLARLGEAADAEVEGLRLARLATLLKAERAAFASVEEAAELLSRLPEKDMTRLGRLVSKIELKEGETLAGLATRSPELHAVVEDAIAKTELLKTMAGKAGGLADEIVEAFHALIGDDGLALADAQKVAAAIPEGEGARFAATLKRIPVGRLAEGSRTAFLELVAASTGRMDAVAKFGADTFWSVYRRVADRGEVLDQYLGTLDEIEGLLAGQGKPGEFRRLLDRLEQDDPATWIEVENGRRVGAGERAISDWAQQLSGSPKAQRGLDRLLRRNQEALVDSLINHLAGDEGLISDPDVVQALEKIAEMSDRELDGLLRRRDVLTEFAEAGRQGVRVEQPEGTQAIGDRPNPRTRAGVTDAEALAADMERRLGPRPPGHHAHHIVPKGMAEAEEAWDILERAHIGINEAENGVWLPADYTVANPLTGEVHASIHTHRYVRWVTAELRDALAHGGPEAVAAKLDELRSIIMNGRAVR